MPRVADFSITTTGGDSNAPTVFEENVVRARLRGYSTVSLAATQVPSLEQATDPNDTWEYFTFINPALFKILETDLIHGYLRSETYERNQTALQWKSEILVKHGMTGSLTLREPQWMPTPWYDDRPELMGCRCEHPAVALSPHWAINIDHPRILDHYRELGRKLAELAPGIGHLHITTNDSGAGINWCQGLYPGPNGPADTRDRDMGERVESWFSAIREGSKAGGREVAIDFSPTHFTPSEIVSVARAFTKTQLVVGATDLRTSPFPNPRLQVFLDACEGTRTRVQYSLDVSNGYAWSGLIAPPQVYWAAEAMMELKRRGIRHLTGSYTCETPLSDSGSPVQMVFERCVERCPRNLAEIETLVHELACDMVGRRHAPALLSAWRDVDTAIRINRMDYKHNYYFFYGTIGRRWLTRPLVPVPAALSKREREYWSSCIMKERDVELAFRTLMAEENRSCMDLAEYASFYNGFELMAGHFERAVELLDTALGKARQGGPARRWLRDQRDRIELFGCLFRNQLHVTGVQWVLDAFADNPSPNKAAMKREKKRLYDMIDGEIANCRRMIELLKEPIAPLLAMGNEETYNLPRNVPALLAEKVKVMRRHRHRVEEVFPGVDEWNFDEPTYSKSGEVITAEDAELE
ncbi:hypothetical protein ACFLSJ_04760 [Verrucomicrobiota bacterium]